MAKGIPTVGFCLGGCIISHALGAAIGPHPDGLHEFGYYEVTPTEAGRAVMPDPIVMPESHFHGFDLPKGARHLASSAYFPNQAYSYGSTTYAFQFHPEVSAAGFRRWQDQPWAPWCQPGVQSRDEQDRLAAQHRPAQQAWLSGFIDRLLGAGD